MRDSLAFLSPVMMNSGFSGLSFSLTPSIHFWTQVRHSVNWNQNPMVKCQVHLIVISIQMVCDTETGNNVTEWGSVKGEKEGTEDRALGYPIGK